MITRRRLLAAAAATTLAPVLPYVGRAGAANAKTLKFIPSEDLTFLDPVASFPYVTRNHGYLVFDTLFGVDGNFNPQPQMAEGHTVSSDGLLWTIKLRDGLLWHDGEKVTAKDCVASLQRWAAASGFGRELSKVTAELVAADDRTIQYRLTRPFPLLAFALASPGTPMCAMMPERLANTDPKEQISEMVGSGPYRFLPDERVVGAHNAYARFEKYVPREDGTPDWTAGPKVAHFDRIEWTTITDAATAASAVVQGEQDWLELASVDLLPIFQTSPDVTVKVMDPTGFMGQMRPNHLQPPFNNPAICRAVFGAIDQALVMQAIVGNDPAMYATDIGFFCPGTPMANDAGLDVLKGPRDYAKVKQDIIDAGYKGEKVVLMAPVDNPGPYAMGQVMADVLQKVGMNVELVTMDRGTLVKRRQSKEPVENGGWSAFFTYSAGSNLTEPAANFNLFAGPENAWWGWPNSPKIEELRAQWIAATDLDAQKAIATELQAQCFQDVPYYPMGLWRQPSAFRSDLQGVLNGFPTFWNVHRS